MIYGLKYVPTIGNDNIDSYGKEYNDSKGKIGFRPDYTARNKEKLREELSRLGTNCKVILEIGLLKRDNDFNDSAMKVILENKPEDCIYIGIDIRDITGRKNLEKNIHVLKGDSGEIEGVMKYINDLGVNKIDLLHIDGFHSVNQVNKDWRYAEFLSEHGSVILHDTACHPGPSELIKAIDEDMFEVNSFFHDVPNDWGITIVRRKVSDEGSEEALGTGNLDRAE